MQLDNPVGEVAWFYSVDKEWKSGSTDPG